MTLTLESIDARVRALESAVFSSAFTFAWKADEDELDLVKAIGGKVVCTSRWPGGGLPNTFARSGLEIIPRYAREKQGNEPALEPLKSSAAINAAVATAERDRDSYKSANVRRVAIGNEPDAANKRFWAGTMYEWGTMYAIHIVPIFRRDFSIIHELPQADINNITPFVLGLLDSGAYQDGDLFSFHSYQRTADEHIGRFVKAMIAVRGAHQRLAALLNSSFCSLEWGISLGGSDRGKLEQVKLLIEKTKMLGISLAAYYRIRRNRHPESYNSPFDERNQPTFTHDFLKSVA